MKKTLVYEEIKAVTNIPNKEDCPWPKGLYNTTESFRLPTEKTPSFFDGDFMAEARFTQDDEVLNGYQVFFTVIRI